MNTPTLLEYTSKFVADKYKDALKNQLSKFDLELQLKLKGNLRNYPELGINNRMVRRLGEGFTVLNLDLDEQGNANAFLWGYFEEEREIEVREDNCFDVIIKTAEELEDIIEFIQFFYQENYRIPKSFNFEKTAVTNLFENIYVFVPAMAVDILPYNMFNEYWKLPEIQWAYDLIEPRKYGPEVKLETLEWAIEEMALRKLKFHELIKQGGSKRQVGDIFVRISGNKEYSFYGYYDLPVPENRKEVYLVFRPKKNTSRMCFRDYLSETQEGAEFLRSYYEGEDPQIEITYLESYMEQIQYAIEGRNIRVKFEAEIEKLLDTKESFLLKNFLFEEKLANLSS